MHRIPMLSRVVALWFCTLFAAGAVADERIQLLAYYTDEAARHYDMDPAGRIYHLVAVANDVLARSGLDARLDLVALERTDYGPVQRAPEALEAITYEQDPAFHGVAGEREAFAADVVMLIGAYAHDGYCGVAWQGGNGEPGVLGSIDRAHAYAFVAIDCSSYTLVHELGHLLGLVHSRRETAEGGTHAWAAGHGVDQSFTTVMATPGVFDAPRLPYFSSPQIHECFGQPCGVDSDDPHHGAFAVAALHETLPQLAAYFSGSEPGAGDEVVTTEETEDAEMSEPEPNAQPGEDPDAEALGLDDDADTERSREASGESGDGANDRQRTGSSSTQSGSQSGSSPSARTSTSDGGGGGGGGCAAGTGHDDPTLPLLLLLSALWVLRQQRSDCSVPAGE